jgi:homoserine dehydrogenase
MTKITLGLIGYGNVGRGVVSFINKRKSFFKDKYNVEFEIKTICDRSIKKKLPSGLEGTKTLTTDYKKIINDPEIDAIIELIGGIQPARQIVLEALNKGKHVVTANKSLLALHGKELFQEAHSCNRNIYYESAVMAGVPLIKMLTEGLAGNKFKSLHGIINGTCNYILTEMTQKDLNFGQALAAAQAKGFAESNPTLDINGMDSANKLAILVSLTMGKFINAEKVYTEGITQISHHDIEHAESLDLTIKLLAIAKKANHEIEARVHPTLISKKHALADVNGIENALFVNASPMGDVLLCGDGAGQMTAASGVISDLFQLASRVGCPADQYLANIYREAPETKIRKIDDISTRFYIRFMAPDKIGVLSKITGILSKHKISINSVTQKAHDNWASALPVIMLTDMAQEKMVRIALNKIHKLGIVKSKPVAIRMEELK